ncbi:MAG: hypothetical protein M9904_02210 [Chitinophagaceae bacterium]|nr:hypothetical protein [Chitinophagaceae bacterium]
MIQVNVDQAIKDINLKFSGLTSRQLDKVASRAINKSLLKGRTEARRAVKDIYNIPQKNLDGINRENSKPSKLEGYVYASKVPIPMDAFSPKFQTASGSITVTRKGLQKTSSFKKKRKSITAGVSIEVYKGKRQIIPYAFMIRGGKPRVFARGEYNRGNGSYGFIRRFARVNKSGSDLPIKPLLSVTVHAAVINDKVMNGLESIVKPYFSKTMEHEIQFELSMASS